MTEMTGFGRALLRSKPAQVGEIVVLFVVALAVIVLAGPLAGENPVAGAELRIAAARRDGGRTW